MKFVKSKKFTNGEVFALETFDNYPIEVTDTFLPYYTKDAINDNSNKLHNSTIGSRDERWMVGISCMSGCPVNCKFCATGNLKKYRKLTSEEMVDQVKFVVNKEENQLYDPNRSKEFKINYTRMGEPFLNIESVRSAIEEINESIPNTHHYISTIGIRGSDFSWIEGNITLQISLHSLNEERRDELIPFRNKMSIEELGQIRTKSKLKTTVNLTLVDDKDFDIELLKKYFDPKYFFIKLSPINVNEISECNALGSGIISSRNIV